MKRSDTLHSLRFGKNHSLTAVFERGSGIADAEDICECWRIFLDALSPRCLKQGENGAVHVPLLQGVWKGDVIFSDTTLLLDLPAEIRAVEGSLAARGAAGLADGWTGSLLVGRHLVLSQRLFLETPPKILVRGDVTVWDAKTPEELHLPPERLHAWGAQAGGFIRLRTSRFRLREAIPGDASSMRLENVQDSTVWVYQRGNWSRSERNLVTPELHEEIFQRLQRVCKIAGLGAGFVIHSPRKTGFNLRRMGSYFHLLARSTQRENAATSDATSAATTAEDAERLLADMDQNLNAENVDPPNIRIMLSVMDDRFAHSLHMENTTPRRRVSEDLLATDMQWLETLRVVPITLERIFRSPRSLGIFLDRALTSSRGGDAVNELLGGIPRNFRALRDSCELAGRVGLDDFLHDPKPLLNELEARSEEAAQFLSLETLERSLVKLDAMKPKDMIRTAFNSRFLREELPDDAAENKRLLSALHSFEGKPDDLPLDKDQVLALFLSEIRSPIVDTLKELEQERQTGELSANKATRVFAANLERLPLTAFAEFLQRRMEWEKDIIRIFNEQAVRPQREEAPARDKNLSGLPPGLLKEVQNRCGRLCIVFGLGRHFLDLRTDCIDDNLGLIIDILSECLAHTPEQSGNKADWNRARMEELVARLEGVRRGLAHHDEEETRHWVEELHDAFLREAASASRTPRPRLDGSSLRRDLGLLALLQTDDITLPTLLGPPREAMRFLASALSSPVAKKLLVRQAAKLKKAMDNFLALPEVKAPRFYLSDILSDWPGLSERLEEFATTYEAQMRLDHMHDALRELDETDVRELITATMAGLVGSHVEDEVQDRRMLLALSRFDTGNLRAAGLRSTSMGLLLLTRLTPVGAEIVKQVFGSVEDAAEKSAIRLVQLAQAKMKRRLAIVDGYNQITPAPRGRR